MQAQICVKGGIMQYEQVWNAVDKLAESQGLSPSGLAKKAGLDATTFNKSKRIRPDGKKRWPSLDSLNKILEVSGLNFEQFYNLAESENDMKFTPSIPFIKCSQLDGNLPIYDKEFVTSDWTQVRFPDGRDKLYAIDIDNNNFAPTYRIGTLLVVSKNSEVRRGDRLVIIDPKGGMMIKEFIRRTATSLEVREIISPHTESSIDLREVLLVNRIVWASQ